MTLTISKRFQFSASHRLHVPQWSRDQNLLHFGEHNQGKWGYGRNYTAYFVFSGPVDSKTGMLINVTEIKREVNRVLDARFDHKFLNKDTPPFDTVNPTVENLAAQLLSEVVPLFRDHAAHPIACHVTQSPSDEATAYSDGRVERHLHIDFSAARRTYAPLLSDRENTELFGIAASLSGHGHHYRMRVTLAGEVQQPLGMIHPDYLSLPVLEQLRKKFDHRNLNRDIRELKEMPMTTEMLAQFFYKQLSNQLPVARVRLQENDYFGVECGYNQDREFYTGLVLATAFHAAHRLHSPHLTDGKNREIYSICNNPNGHGHRYEVETLLCGIPDKRSGTIGNLLDALSAMERAIEPWKFKHLDRDTTDFTENPSTAENIIRILFDRMSRESAIPVSRLRLWETENNRFTLRRS